jgi:L-ribulose-5-phosphate 4-epimerase
MDSLRSHQTERQGEVILEQEGIFVVGVIETSGAERFSHIDPVSMPGVLVNGHAPFSWGNNPHDAVHNAVVIEEVCKIAFHTYALNPAAAPIEQSLLDKHYLRKHGKNAYYGQL